MNIASLLVKSGGCYGNRPAVMQGNKSLLDYSTLATHSAMIANSLLTKYQLDPGDRVAIIAENCPEYIELYFAIWHAGLVVVPINAKLHSREFAYVLQNSGSKVCFVSKKRYAQLVAISDDCPALKPLIVIGSDDYQQLCQGEPMDMAERHDDDAAWLFYTSGTTGKPKGAVQSHRNLLVMTQSYFTDVDNIDAGDCILHAAPMSHGGGYYILPHIAHGGINVIPNSGGFNEQEMLELIATHQGVSFFAAPTMVKRLVEHVQSQRLTSGIPDFSNLKTIIYGGGPMYQADLHNAHQLLGNKLVQIYGQGECPMSITSLTRYMHADTNHHRYASRLASVGVAMTGIEVKIADPSGNRVDNGQPGEIMVRGDAVMLGYFEDPGATSQTIIDGWLKTGDMAKQDNDGFITLVDRSKDVIISGGTNIYPREIEEVLNQHPSVIETSVIGRKDADWGEVVIAVVVIDPTQMVSSEQLDQYSLDNMARFKRPKDYIFVDKLPKNNTGKILKTELRKRYA